MVLLGTRNCLGSNQNMAPACLIQIQLDWIGGIPAVATRCLCCHAEVPHTGAQVCASRLLSRNSRLCFVCQSSGTGDIVKWLCDSSSSCHSLLSINRGRMKPSAPLLSLKDGRNLSFSANMHLRMDWIFWDRSLLNPGHSLCLPFLAFPTSFLSIQVYRGFARTLKWWSDSSQTDSGGSAGLL